MTQKFNCLTEDLCHGEHALDTDQLKIALTNTAPAVGDSLLTDLVEIDYTNCSSRTVTTSSSGQTDGDYLLTLADLTITASGVVGPFRYAVLYNDSNAVDPLMLFKDYGSEVVLSAGETFLIDFTDASGGAISL